MSETKHTKNCRVEFRKGGYEVWGDCGLTGSMKVATCGFAESFDRANAHLFAAALDLLEACKGLVAMDDADGMGVTSWEDLFNAARAAIAKAEEV